MTKTDPVHPAGPAAARRTDPEPPPPGGVLWTIAGDVRALLMLPAAFTMQVAHPAIAAGVDQYSVFRTDPWGRGERSLRSVQLWVYGGEEAAEEGRRVRRLHKDIQGTDTRGRRYHSLDPACYAWVHATGFPVYLYAGRYLLRRFTPPRSGSSTRSGSRWGASSACATGTCRRASRSTGRTGAGCWPRRSSPPRSPAS